MIYFVISDSLSPLDNESDDEYMEGRENAAPSKTYVFKHSQHREHFDPHRRGSSFSPPSRVISFPFQQKPFNAAEDGRSSSANFSVSAFPTYNSYKLHDNFLKREIKEFASEQTKRSEVYEQHSK